MIDITIREYEDSDWLAASTIHDKARPIELDGSCEKEAFLSLDEDKNGLRSFMSSTKHVACKNKKVVGFVGIKEREITWLYVEPSEFGQGIGRHLLKFALEIIGGEATTSVLEGNHSARALYQSEGFRVASKVRSENNGYACVVLKLKQ